MKATKGLIILFAVLGLSWLVVPYDGAVLLPLWIKGAPRSLEFLAYFVPGLLMGLVMMKPPAPMWAAVVALAGFSFGFVRLHLWEVIPRIPDGGLKNIGQIVLVVAILGGMLVSIIGVVKPEPTA